ncbi:MAG: acyl carrier protein [Geobacteraceae bacterium]|nr:acyl carrier protein [Geobacteraceae bacterium]NTW80406.1 acyl carrier protein [Geobacteraceae bacterium]
MTEKELKEIVFTELKKIAPECDPDDVDPDENIREALDIDSYSFLQLIIALSDSTGVDIVEADYEKVFTLEGMLRYLSARID